MVAVQNADVQKTYGDQLVSVRVCLPGGGRGSHERGAPAVETPPDAHRRTGHKAHTFRHLECCFTQAGHPKKIGHPEGGEAGYLHRNTILRRDPQKVSGTFVEQN